MGKLMFKTFFKHSVLHSRVLSEHVMYSGQKNVSDCEVCHYDKGTLILNLFYNVILPYRYFFHRYEDISLLFSMLNV